MKTQLQLIALSFLLSIFCCQLSAFAQGTAFTYQGQLNDKAGPASGLYDFQFGLYDAATGGTELGMAKGSAVPVTNGLFTVNLDFGAGGFSGAPRWLEINVVTNNGPSFITLSPRQPLTPTPYAMFAPNAGSAASAASITGPIAASQLTGTISSANIGVGSIASNNLAPGAAAANLAAGGVSAVPSSGIVLSQREVNQRLLNAGFVPLGTSLGGTGEAWTALSNGPPATGSLSPGRYGHRTVWTGTEMLILGGTPDKTGLRYNPSANTWSVMNKSNAPAIGDDMQAAWSGSQLLVWDAYHRIGGRYTPGTDTWQIMSDTNSPSARNYAASGFAGGYFVVWGGTEVYDDTLTLNTGGRYNPANDTWIAMSQANAPARRANASAAGIGSDVVFFGGFTTNDVTYCTLAIPPNCHTYRWPAELGSGARYNPAANTWTPMTSAPVGRDQATLTWSGTDLYVWGGVAYTYHGYRLFQSPGYSEVPVLQGLKYHPATDTWTALSTNGQTTIATDHTAVWSGSSLLIWGGNQFLPYTNGYGEVELAGLPTSSGARYNPASDTWSPLAPSGATPRTRHAAVWTGTQMVIWGGKDEYEFQKAFGDGFRYTLASDTWSATATPPSSGEPSERSGAASVWTGDALIVWGGTSSNTWLRSGGIYRPGLGWTNTPDAGAPSARSGPAAVWTGSEMIIWGGQASAAVTLNTGERFNVSSNRWFPMTTLNAPRARVGHSAIWTGTEMIIFGGSDFTNVFFPTFLGTGAAYNPATDTWREIPPNAFMTGAGHAAVWTGKEMILWGGYTHSGGIVPTYNFNHLGFRYDPATNQWTYLIASAPISPRYQETAVWSGSEMLVWGGRDSGGLTNSGARYNPVTDTWSLISTTNAPTARSAHVAVWADEPGQMIVWGGYDGSSYVTSGAHYDPLVDKWTTMTNNAPPIGRYAEVAAWTGSQMLIFDGANTGGTLSDGRAFTPRKNYYLYQKP